MAEKRFDTDCVQLVLQGLLGRKVSIDEVVFFIESKAYGILDYDEMWQRVWEQFHTGDVPLHLIPLEVMLFRRSEHCITPKSKLEDCLWLDIGNLGVYTDEIEVLLSERCGDCACFHVPTDLCTHKREKVDYRQIACEYFIWD